MWKSSIFMLLITTFFVQVANGWLNEETHEKIQLKDVKVLTLHKGQMTKGRRSSPVPQLNCIGGDAKYYDKYRPQVVRCTNKGWDLVWGDYKWECKAKMSDNVRFGVIYVTCEGYNHPHDNYVLAGSCGLNYNLEFTEVRRKNHNGYEDYLISTVIVVVFLLICFSGAKSRRSTNRFHGRSRRGTSRTTSRIGGTRRR